MKPKFIMLINNEAHTYDSKTKFENAFFALKRYEISFMYDLERRQTIVDGDFCMWKKQYRY